jgi:aryl-alcohol dehydrogenase-like predicted oxidoreductase
MFRLKPAEELFPTVREKKIGILARVPLASGLLSGKLRRDSTFEPRDHRNYNRHGEAFDVGETFSGVDYETGLAAVEELRALVPAGATMAQRALRWILMFPEVTAAIPGAKNVQQTEDNIHAAALPSLTPEQMATVRKIYDRSIRPLVHHRW